jgi:MFS family permease
MEEIKPYRFSWAQAKDLFRTKTMWFVALGGFFGIIPWTVIIYFFFDFLGRERGYNEQSVLLTMAPLVLIMAVGTFLGGWLGDWLFARNRKGRIIVIVVTILLAVVFLWAAMSIPVENKVLFFILMAITAFVMPMAGANLTSTMTDVIVPEVRSSANAVLNLIGDSGNAFAPIAAGIVADSFNIGAAILWVGGIAWLIAALSYGVLLFFIDNDIDHLRSTMKERATLQAQTK